MSTANWDLEDHRPSAGPFYQLGAVGAVPSGLGVVVGGAIPYKPEARVKREENRRLRWENDPELNCYMPGIPRATYLPYPFEIVEGTKTILMAYQYASVNRPIYMDHEREPQIDSWMGISNGHWDGDTLVVTTSGFNDKTWLDRSGNYHSINMVVTERFQMLDRDHIRYTATIEDPDIFERPWDISLVLYRNIEPDARIVEFKCVPFSEERLYRDLRKVDE